MPGSESTTREPKALADGWMACVTATGGLEEDF